MKIHARPFSLERNLFAFLSFLVIDCLHFAFSLKIRLVLISASAIANHDGLGPDDTLVSLVYRGSRLCRSRAWVSRAVTLQRKIRGCSQSILVKAMFSHFSGTYSRRARSKSKHTTIPRWSSAFSECNFKKQQLTIRAHHFSERVRVPSENKTRLKEGSVLTQKWLPIPLGGQIQTEAEINFRVNLCGTQKQDLPC